VDSVSGQNYEHRREWIETFMMKLASVFAVDIAAFAVMSNHYHLVIRVDQERAQNWSDEEVLERWTQLFTGPVYLQRYLADPQAASDSLKQQVSELTQVYRQRLYDLSWYMRVLNESIARMANKEDGVKGHFWEGRFKSQALLDEQAILSVMAYVDLNPVRANMSEDLAHSDYTSIQRRLQSKVCDSDTPCQLPPPNPNATDLNTLQSLPAYEQLAEGAQEFLTRLMMLPNAQLMGFDPSEHSLKPRPVIAFDEADYFEFVDYLGRAVHPKKKGHIAATQPKLMDQLNLTDALVDTICQGKLLKNFGSAIGNPIDLNQHRQTHHQAFHKGDQTARVVFG
jgi:REP element-mobilizing transposase RayT